MKQQHGLLLAMLLGVSQLAIAQQATDEDQETSPAMPTTEQEEQAGDTQGAAREQSGFSSGSVMRSAFTTRIEDREPVDDVAQLDNETREVYYFTELRDMEGQTARHRWEYQGEVMAEVEFNVKGPRWRVWSSKRILPDWTGEWTVSVINAADEVIATDSVSYVEATSSADDTGAMPAGEAEAAPAENDVEESSAGEAGSDNMTPDASSPMQD
ncbi:DUF2914 domain-containing protein [Thiohalophilus sp.]|uniref:DUF2914 domain-containing protein n=1 Tax=Thiohalophilus sp. TaxID=3028392 RepID=UPI002ACE61A0|nr:DUF2914 domain-containing protein [Thiohalophilus sp.]MDZ7662363.1 DUF2914 domain-containing protein [Thiohalophilus sp.]